MALVTGAQLAAALSLDYDPLDPDEGIDQVAETADELVAGLLTDGAYALEPAPCKEAALHVAVDIYQARYAAGGQVVATDFSPGPYRMSSAVLKRVDALIGAYKDVTGMVG